jgi:RNA-directed DNA polymerase
MTALEVSTAGAFIDPDAGVMPRGCAPLRLGPSREQFSKQYRRYGRAIEDGHGNKIRQLENLLLKSHSGKMLAVARAAKEKKYPLYPAKLDLMADALSCWEQPAAPATLYFKKKPDGSLRSIFSYRVMQAAQQYLVWWVLAPRVRLHLGQYAVAGRDRTAAVVKAMELMEAGYDWVIRGDIKNCYPSMNGEKVLDNLPGPRAVLRQVVLPPLEQHLLYSKKHAALIRLVRRGLPQGAASTALVAAAALVPVLNELPDDVVPILYVDDFAIFAKSKAAAAHAMNTLREALRAAPVGHLELKICNIHHVTDGFRFLGYEIFRDEGGGATARPLLTAVESLYEQLEAIDAGPSLDPHGDKMGKLISWRCSYAAWDGDELTEEHLNVVLSNHFSGDLGELVQKLHLRAQITREREKKPRPLF